MFDMQPTSTQDQKKAKRDARKAESFSAFMASPSAKLAISLVPTNESHPEALTTLLWAAFEAGHQSGAGEIAAEMIEAMVAGMAKREGRGDQF